MVISCQRKCPRKKNLSFQGQTKARNVHDMRGITEPGHRNPGAIAGGSFPHCTLAEYTGRMRHSVFSLVYPASSIKVRLKVT